MKKTILVIGATGNQGGAVVQALLQVDFSIRAFVRPQTPTKPKSEKINQLEKQGIEVAEGNLDNFDSLVQAMNGVYGVFSVINFQDGGVAKEEERGKRVADAAKKAGVQHFIYSSVGGADRNSGVPHFESKWHVEEHIRKIGLPYSIVRPTTFMVNLVESPAIMRFIALSMFRGGEKPVQMIAVEDIGKWVAHMFLNKSQYLGKAVEISGDEVTFDKMINAYQKVYRKKLWSIKLPYALFSKGDLGKMVVWINKHGYQADLKANREAIPELLTYEQFIAQKRQV